MKQPPGEKPPGFQDVVKNPYDWREEIDESERALAHARRASASWDEQTVGVETRRILFDTTTSPDAWVTKCVLRDLGTRTHPALLACLRDNTIRGRLVTPTEAGTHAETPFRRLCELLAENPPPACVPLLASFLDDPSAEVRKEAALVIGCVGSEACVVPLRKALADSDEYVRSYAMIGLQRALKANRLDDVCRRDIFPDVQSVIGRVEGFSYAAELLLELNEPHAIEFLLSDRILAADFAYLPRILSALSDKGVLVPRERLLGLVRSLHAKEMKYPATSHLGEALRALGLHRAADDRSTLEHFLTHADAGLASGAAAGLIASHGLEGYRDTVWSTVKERGVGGLTEGQRHFYAVTIFDGEVNNGGLSQFFFNSSGDEWPAAAAGLEAMGAKERLAILREAVARFGKDGPSTNRAARMSQLSTVARADDDAFSKLDTRYYQIAEVLDVTMSRYVLAKPEAFR